MKSAAVLMVAAALLSGTTGAQAPRASAQRQYAVPAARTNEGGRAGTRADSVPLSTAEAEARGARLPHAAPNFVFPDEGPRMNVAGSGARKCVAVDGVNVARSGEFLARGFDIYNTVWPTGYGKIAWETPKTMRGDPPPLTVRAARLDSDPATRVFTIPGSGPYDGNVLFYPSGVHVPTNGRWMLVATAGPNWGCFLLTVN